MTCTRGAVINLPGGGPWLSFHERVAVKRGMEGG
jgi:hypothetical protein